MIPTCMYDLHEQSPLADQHNNILQVLKNGVVKEFDSPYTLLQDPNSKFFLMVEKTGLNASGRLHQMALESHLKKKLQKNGRITPAQRKGVKRMSYLFAQSLLHRTTGSGLTGGSQLQERQASNFSSNTFPRTLSEMGVNGNPRTTQQLPSDPVIANE